MIRADSANYLWSLEPNISLICQHLTSRQWISGMRKCHVLFSYLTHSVCESYERKSTNNYVYESSSGATSMFESEKDIKWMDEWMDWSINEWMNEWMDRWMDGWMDEWIDEGIDEWMDEWMDGLMDGWKNEWMNERMTDWMNEWTNEWMDELMN